MKGKTSGIFSNFSFQGDRYVGRTECYAGVWIKYVNVMGFEP